MDGYYGIYQSGTERDPCSQDLWRCVGNPERELSGPHVVGSLGEFVLCDLALSPGSQRQSLSMLITGSDIERRTLRDVLFQCLKDCSTASLDAYSSYIAWQ